MKPRRVERIKNESSLDEQKLDLRIWRNFSTPEQKYQIKCVEINTWVAKYVGRLMADELVVGAHEILYFFTKYLFKATYSSIKTCYAIFNTFHRCAIISRRACLLVVSCSLRAVVFHPRYYPYCYVPSLLFIPLCDNSTVLLLQIRME